MDIISVNVWCDGCLLIVCKVRNSCLKDVSVVKIYVFKFKV